jgi:hypothetical protein
MRSLSTITKRRSFRRSTAGRGLSVLKTIAEADAGMLGDPLGIEDQSDAAVAHDRRPGKARQWLQRAMHGFDDDLLALEDFVHDQAESPRAGFYDGKQREIGFRDGGRSRRLGICGGRHPQFRGLVHLHDCPPPLGIERRWPAKDLG